MKSLGQGRDIAKEKTGFLIVDTTGRGRYPEEALSRIADLPAKLEKRGFSGSRELEEACSGADIIMVSGAKITRDLIAKLPVCKGIVRYGVGLDNIDLAAASERGIEVAGVRGFCVSEMAEHCLGLIVNLARRINLCDRRVKEGGWEVSWEDYPLYRLSGKTAGIIGLGAVGKALARMLSAIEMEVLAHDPFLAAGVAEDNVKITGLDCLLQSADVVSVNCPLTDKTRRMIGRAEFGKMKKNAFIINTARGPIIDEEALADALSEKRIAGAGLDVLVNEPPFAGSPLLGMENVILTPHISWYSAEAENDLVAGAFEQVRMMILNLMRKKTGQ